MGKYIDTDALKIEIMHHIELMENEPTRYAKARIDEANEILSVIDALSPEYESIDLEEFTEKMNAWKARYKRYNHPDNILIKSTMAFTARMFYMYPDIARKWYDDLPKVTMD